MRYGTELYEATVDMTLFDDFGAEQHTRRGRASNLNRLVDHRYMHALPTVWATNLNVAEEDGRIGLTSYATGISRHRGDPTVNE